MKHIFLLMKKLFYIILIFIGISFVACTKPISQAEQDVIVLDLSANIQKEIRLSSFVDSITYIPMETCDESLIGQVKDILITDSFVFVLPDDRTSILIFSEEGKFVRKINKVGSGPGEYNVIDQFSYNERRQSIAVASYKIIEYDLYGNLKNEFESPFHISDLHLFDNGDYLLSRLGKIEDPEELVVLTDGEGNIKESLFKRNPEYKIWSTSFWELATYKDQVHFISPQIENNIYSYKNGRIACEFHFQVIPEIPSDFYQRKSGVLGLGEHFYRTLYRESESWVNLIFHSQTMGVRRILYNKGSGECRIGTEVVNDMDDRVLCHYCSSCDNNTFTNLVEPENENDNPVIQVLHLK